MPEDDFWTNAPMPMRWPLHDWAFNDDDENDEGIEIYQGFEVGTRVTINPQPGRPAKTGIISRIEAIPNDTDYVNVWIAWICES